MAGAVRAGARRPRESWNLTAAIAWLHDLVARRAANGASVWDKNDYVCDYKKFNFYEGYT